MAKQLTKKTGPTIKVTPRKSVKIDGKLYLGGEEATVTYDVLKKMQDMDAATVSEPGESTVRSLLSDEDQAGRPREFVEGTDEDEPYARTEDEDQSEESLDESEEDEEEETEETEEEDPDTGIKKKTTRKKKRASRR